VPNCEELANFHLKTVLKPVIRPIYANSFPFINRIPWTAKVHIAIKNIRGQQHKVHPFPQKVPNCEEPANFHLKKNKRFKTDDSGILQ
jgi:hypothetical protein